jgi:hypothetical protein
MITIATQPHPILDLLKKKVELHDESIEILGLRNEAYTIGQDLPNARRMAVKLREVYNFINRETLNENDIVLFTDAYDVYYSGNKETVIKNFKEMNKPIVFGAEQCCYPDGSKAGLYPPTSSCFRYLNSGLFIGRVHALRECMNNIENEFMTNDNIDDQLWWTEKFLERPDLIELDYHNTLFLNCVWLGEHQVIINGDKVTTIFNKNVPQLIHGNGPSKEFVYKLANYANNAYNFNINTPKWDRYY